jgi:general secretion pathway protein D
LGTRDNIKRFEDFIIKYVDKTLDIPFSPLHIIQLKYIDATSMARILNDLIQKFNADPANAQAALVGGVRDGNKFFRPSVRITEEPSGNRLIINSDYEEYLKLRELIEKLDVEQPQVAIKMLILNVDLSNTTALGTQLRNKVDCCDDNNGLFSSNVNFQTAMLGPIVTNPPIGVTPTPVPNGAERLLGNLIRLADRVNGIAPFDIGTTLVTLGKDIFGFWGLLRALQTYTRTSVIANPFLIATHKYKAEFKVGETRRTVTAVVEGQREAEARGDLSADLRIVVTPQISYDDTVYLNIYFELGQFVDPITQDRIIRKISTEALIANKEVLALGGLIRDRVIETTAKVPVLGDIPLLGWFFKNKSKTVERTSLLVLISAEIIKPYEPQVAQAFTYSKITDAKDNLFRMRDRSERRDPIHRWLFNDHKDKESTEIDKFVAMQQRYIDESQRKPEVPAFIRKKEVKKTAPAQSLLDFVKTKPEGIEPGPAEQVQEVTA